METSGNEKPDSAQTSIVICERSLRDSRVDITALRKEFAQLRIVTDAELSHGGILAGANVVIVPFTINEKPSYHVVWKANEHAQVLILDANLSVSKTASAMQNGVVDVLSKPVSTERLLLAIQRAVFLGNRPSVSGHRYLWNIFKAMERMNQCHDEMRLLHIFSNAVMRETLSKAAVIFHEEEGKLKPLKSVLPQQTASPLSRMECLGVGRHVELGLGNLGDRPGYATLPSDFKILHLGIIKNMLLVPIVSPGQKLVVCFLDPPDLMQRHVSLDVIASFAHHTGGALEAAKNYRRVSELVYIDDVTGLYNARYLPVVLDAKLKTYEKDKTSFTVLFIDIDRFKEVNDTYGHLVGSEVLVRVGHVIRRSVRYDDAVFRYGGDEFVVVLNSTEADGGFGAAERIRKNIESHVFVSHGHRVSVTASIGVAAYPQHGVDAHTVVDHADKAMYEGKKRSRNIVLMCNLGQTAA